MKSINQTALITGASSGIGWDLAHVFAGNGYDLILVARRRERLEKLAGQLGDEHGIEALVLPKDLAVPGAGRQLFDEVTAQGKQVDILVNNAGIGAHGMFSGIDWRRQADLLQLNIIALTELTYLFLPQMKERGRGKILNVGSTAGFFSGPFKNTYYASKAYVYHFSMALREELKKTGITVSVLCPGPTETEFFEKAGAVDTPLSRMRSMKTAEKVAEAGYRGLMKGKAVVVTGAFNKVAVFLARFLPRGLVTAVVGWANGLVES